MPSIRQDAWMHAEDVKLAEIILRHIKEGSTQLAGFAEAGSILSRTPAACGFRWNSSIRKLYDQELQEAKAIRKARKKKKKKGDLEARLPKDQFAEKLEQKRHISESEIDQLIRFLTDLKEQSSDGDSEEEENLLREKQQLESAYQQLKDDYTIMKQNYESLLNVFKVVDQARKEIPAIKES